MACLAVLWRGVRGCRGRGGATAGVACRAAASGRGVHGVRAAAGGHAPDAPATASASAGAAPVRVAPAAKGRQAGATDGQAPDAPLRVAPAIYTANSDTEYVSGETPVSNFQSATGSQRASLMRSARAAPDVPSSAPDNDSKILRSFDQVIAEAYPTLEVVASTSSPDIMSMCAGIRACGEFENGVVLLRMPSEQDSYTVDAIGTLLTAASALVPTAPASDGKHFLHGYASAIHQHSVLPFRPSQPDPSANADKHVRGHAHY